MSIISDIVNTALNINKKNIKVIIILILLFLLLLPVLNKIIIIPVQLSQEIELLNKIVEINKVIPKSAEENQLKQKILADVRKFLEERSFTFDPFELYKNNPGKFFSGISLWILVFILLLFQKIKFISKIAAMILVLIIGLFLGYISMLIPDLFSPWINYIGFPLLQIIFIFSIYKINNQQPVTTSNKT
jgi:hypothetical protein